MAPDRRWEGDERGKGVASGAELAAPLHRFAALLADESWVTEEPVRHLGPKLTAWLAGHIDDWADVEPADEQPWLTVRATWIGEASRRALRAGAIALLGAMAESELFVRQIDFDDRLVFEAATGLDGPDFAPHGHLIRLIVYPRVAVGGGRPGQLGEASPDDATARGSATERTIPQR
jgi:hypothetical protein